MSDRTKCYMCQLYVQPWREGLHNICARCERDSLARAWPDATWVLTLEQMEEHLAMRQASEGVRLGLQNPLPYGWDEDDQSDW